MAAWLPNGATLLGVLRRAPPAPTLLVTDEPSPDALHVRLRRLRFFSATTLCSDHVQSEMQVAHDGSAVLPHVLCMPYHRLMMLLPQAKANQVGDHHLAAAVLPAPKRVLVLGHGAGALTSFCCVSWPNVKVVSVDADADVIEAGKRFFSVRGCPFANVDIHHQDALNFLRVSADDSGPFDRILVDINASNEDTNVEGPMEAPPASLVRAGIASLLSGACTKSGFVAVNVLGGSPRQHRLLERRFQRHFAWVQWLDAPRVCSNRILLAQKTEFAGYVLATAVNKMSLATC